MSDFTVTWPEENMAPPTWVILDVEEQAKGEHEITLPPRAKREGLKFGWHVKLLVEFGEKKIKRYVWVQVSDVGDKIYEGVLSGKDAHEYSRALPSTLTFEPKNVLDFVDA